MVLLMSQCSPEVVWSEIDQIFICINKPLASATSMFNISNAGTSKSNSTILKQPFTSFILLSKIFLISVILKELWEAKKVLKTENSVNHIVVQCFAQLAKKILQLPGIHYQNSRFMTSSNLIIISNIKLHNHLLLTKLLEN